MRRTLVTLVVAFALGDPALAEEAQSAAVLSRRVTIRMPYLVALPEGYAEHEAWPLLVFLHGSGERGEDVEKVKIHGPPKLVEAGRRFPFVVVSPQCSEGRRWNPVELTALIDEIVERYEIDEDRIYLTGLSMGGFGTWDLATWTPRRFAAIVPICGGGRPRSAKLVAHVPTWVFHGADDKAVPLERSEEMVAALRKAGGEPRFTIYPNTGHDAWTKTYENPQLYEWLLQQRRKPLEQEE